MSEIITPENAEIGKRRSRCYWCRKKIINKEPRIREIGKFKEHYYNRYFCFKCGEGIIRASIGRLNDEMKRLRKESKRLIKLMEKNKEIMILSNLENEK